MTLQEKHFLANDWVKGVQFTDNTPPHILLALHGE